MKIDRLIGILSILLQQEKVTAPYLADKFEVSRRTINRDIENLCKAGIPIVTAQGKNGGITVMDGYRVDRTLFTPGEMRTILAGLAGIDSVTAGKELKQLMDKLKAGSSDAIEVEHGIRINLASWYEESLVPKIRLIRQAIGSRQVIRFRYYSPSEESVREIEPCLLIFQWASWYVWGYCRNRENFRMFKLNRVEELEGLDQQFEKRELPEKEAMEETMFTSQAFMKNEIKVTALLDKSVKWRLIDEYGIRSFEEQADGRLLAAVDFSCKEQAFQWILSFGQDAELLEPAWVRAEFGQMAAGISRIYDGEGKRDGSCER